MAERKSMTGEPRRDGAVRRAMTIAFVLGGVLAVSACRRTDTELEGTDPTAAPAQRVETSWERYVVVLPFENLGEPEDVALVAGLTEEIRARITALPSVAVISADRAGLKGLRAIGHPQPDIERYYDLILDGSIRWAPGEEIETKIRIVERGWEPGHWNREWTDPRSVEALLATQSAIAAEVQRILDSPEPNVTGPNVAIPKRTDSIDAYEAYLRGLSAENGPSDLEESIRWLSQAARQDPGFAVAHARLSERHSELYRLATTPSAERLAEAKAAVDRALELEPVLAEAQRALGLYHLASGNHEPALEALEAAALKMPEDAQTLAALGLVHWNREELVQAENRWKQALRLSAKGDLAFRLGRLAERLGDGESAQRWFEYADRLGYLG